MNQWITNAKVVALAVFVIASLATIGYEWRYVWPVRRCEARGSWWDPKDRQCLIPLPIWRITNRGGPAATPPPPAPPKTAG